MKPVDAPLYRRLFCGFEVLERVFRRRRNNLYLHPKETLQDLLLDLFVRPTHLQVTTTDERDKVYGLLGLAGDVDELGIRPDYARSTTVAQVFTHTARAIIQKNKRLEILRYGRSLGPVTPPEVEKQSSPERTRLSERHATVESMIAELDLYSQKEQSTKKGPSPQKEPDVLPSWVPGWKYRAEHTFQGIREIFSACGKFVVADILHTSSPTTLGVRGFRVDTITFVGDQAPLDTKDDLAVVAFFDSFKRLLTRRGPENIYSRATKYGHYLDDTLRWLPAGYHNIVLEDRPQTADFVMAAQYREWMLKCDVWASMDDEWKDQIAAYEAGDSPYLPAAKRRMDELFRAGYFLSWSIANGRRPYLTKKGYLGMGSAYLQPGDKVVVFYGDTIPYIVRRVPEREDSMYSSEPEWSPNFRPDSDSEDDSDPVEYLLVGETYCEGPGVMSGELADRAKRKDFYLIWSRLFSSFFGCQFSFTSTCK